MPGEREDRRMTAKGRSTYVDEWVVNIAITVILAKDQFCLVIFPFGDQVTRAFRNEPDEDHL